MEAIHTAHSQCTHPRGGVQCAYSGSNPERCHCWRRSEDRSSEEIETEYSDVSGFTASLGNNEAKAISDAAAFGNSGVQAIFEAASPAGVTISATTKVKDGRMSATSPKDGALECEATTPPSGTLLPENAALPAGQRANSKQKEKTIAQWVISSTAFTHSQVRGSYSQGSTTETPACHRR